MGYGLCEYAYARASGQLAGRVHGTDERARVDTTTR